MIMVDNDKVKHVGHINLTLVKIGRTGKHDIGRHT